MKKIFSLILCVVVMLSSFLCGSFSASAIGEECIITVDTISAIPGDQVMVNLNIKNNPGIMAMTISITYDSDALEYVEYGKGTVFRDYTVAAHPTRKLIRLVISQGRDYYGDGIIASFYFKVLEKAEFDLHEMTVDYSSGDFCNNNLERLMPTIVPGGVDVQFNGSNCSHKNYSDWVKTLPPSCEDNGAYTRTCQKCGHFEIKPIEPIGHEFSDKWTVDIPATEDSYGTMSRHCIRCDEVIDETNFSLEDSDKGDIDNSYEAEVPENDVVSDIIEEQYPDIDFDNLSSTTSGSSSSETTASDRESSDDITISDTSSNGTSSNDTASSVGNNSVSNNSESNSDNSEDSVLSDNLTEPSDDTYQPTEEEKKQTEDQIKEIIEIIYPENENNEENAKSIAEVLREAIPNFDKHLKTFRRAFAIVLLLVLL